MERAISTTPAVETWRPVVGYEGLYEVSSFGQVRSLDKWQYIPNATTHRYLRKGRVLKLRKNTGGYMIIALHKNKTSAAKLVHRLVAQAFIPNPDNLPEVNHKDQDRLNNRVENLEWCDRLYNVNYADGRERQRKAVSHPIEQLTMDGQHVAYYLGIKAICRNTNMNRSTIQRCLHGRKSYLSAYGYRWRYADKSKDEIQFATDYSLVKYQKKDTTHT